jgi:glycosyltransferase involved in cell wall biosynthesis
LKRLIGATARKSAWTMWRILPARWQNSIRRRVDAGTLPGPLRFAVRSLAPRLGVDAALPFDKIDLLVSTGPRVSVVIPCFDHGSYLNETLDSLQAQTYPFFEVIIVDDGSTDAATLALLEKLDRPKLDLRVIQQENQGPAVARNTGIAAARGRYILPLDADDTIERTCLTQMVALLDSRPDLGIAYCDIRFFGATSSVTQAIEYDLNELLRENFMVVTSLFRKTLFDEVGGYWEELEFGYEDWCLWIDFAALGYYGKRIPEPLFNYRIKKQSRNVEAVANNKTLIRQIRTRNADLYADDALQQMWRTHSKWHDALPRAMPAGTSPLVTILIPCYNYGEYVEQTIRSATDQTHQNIEILVLDDGSTDPETLRVLREHSWPKTRVVRHDNMGLAATRNRGFELARGSFVLPVDADDILMPQMVEKALEVMADNLSTGWVYTDIRFIGDVNGVHKQEDYNFALELTNNHSSVCALIRKQAWLDAGGYNPNMDKGYEDWNFWVSCSAAGWHGKVLDAAYFGYRLHGVSMYTESLKNHQYLVSRLRNNHPLLFLPWNFEAIRSKWIPLAGDRRHLPVISVEGSKSSFVPAGDRPLISILVPVYKHHQFLRQCLDSALQQAGPEFEVIVIDDGSNDPKIDEILEHFKTDERVRVFVNETNSGIVSTLNRGIIAARGDYFAFLDCDDFLTKNALKEVGDYILSGETKYCISTQILDVDDGGNVLRHRGRHETPKDLYRGNFAGHFKVVKREAIERIGLFHEDVTGCQDYDLVFRIQEHFPIHFLQRYLYCYRWHGATVSVSQSEAQDTLSDTVVGRARYRRWLRDDSVLKSFHERICVLLPGRFGETDELATLRASTGLPLTVLVEQEHGVWHRFTSRSRAHDLTWVDTIRSARLEHLIDAVDALWVTALKPNTSTSEDWLEYLYFTLTIRQTQGAGPLRAIEGSPDLSAVQTQRCETLPLWGTLFEAKWLSRVLGSACEVSTTMPDTIATSLEENSKLHVEPMAQLIEHVADSVSEMPRPDNASQAAASQREEQSPDPDPRIRSS